MNDRREIVGWAMYDWAISAFSTTVVTVLLGPYLTALAQAAVGENGTVLDLGPFGAITATNLFPSASPPRSSSRSSSSPSWAPSPTTPT